MPFYSSVDQLLRDRSELARKGISRGRSVVVLTYAGGVLFVAENRGRALRKVSEIYDRIGLAAVGDDSESDQLYRVTYDGSITDEPQFVVMGGTTDPISAKLKETYRAGLDLPESIAIAVEGLQSGIGNGAQTAAERVLGVSALEVAVLDRSRPRRTFRRIEGPALRDLLPEANRAVDAPAQPPAVAGGDDVPAGGGAVEGDQQS
jgi:proteasome alpha subunit